MPLSPDEIKMRLAGVSASDISAIVGVSPWRSALDVYLEKTGRQPSRGSARTKLGERMEPVIRDWYLEQQPPAEFVVPRTMRHPTIPWAMATPDILMTMPDGSRKLAEFKMVGTRVRSRWQGGTLPPYVLTQVIWQQFVTQVFTADVGVWFGLEEEDQQILPCTYDAEIAEGMREAAERFWTDCVQRDEPPPVEPSEDWSRYLTARFPQHTAPAIEAPPEAERWVRQFLAAEAALKAAEGYKQQAKNELEWMLGFSEGMQGPDFRVTWKSDARGGIDYKAAIEEMGANPEFLDRFRRSASRRFLVKTAR